MGFFYTLIWYYTAIWYHTLQVTRVGRLSNYIQNIEIAEDKAQLDFTHHNNDTNPDPKLLWCNK